MTVEEALECADQLKKLQDEEYLNQSFDLPHPYTIYESLIVLAREYRIIEGGKK